MQWMKFSTLVLVIALVLGSAATVVKAAEASLPGQLLYPLKIMSEDVQAFDAAPEAKAQQSMIRVENRIQEILRLREQNKQIQEAVYLRLENQLELTFRLMAGLPDDALISGLLEFQSRLMAQERLLQELQAQGQRSDDAVLVRIRTMLQAKLQLVGEGIEEPQKFKLEIRDRERIRGSWSEEGNPPGGAPGYGTSVGPIGGTPTPGAYGPGPGPVGSTPTAGAYGPGPGPIDNTPTAGVYGPGPGPIEITPTPGGYGPGPAPVEVTPTNGEYGPGAGQIDNTPTPGGYGPGGTPTPDDPGPGGE